LLTARRSLNEYFRHGRADLLFRRAGPPNDSADALALRGERYPAPASGIATAIGAGFFPAARA
jgi:hypothetical protein